jgi:hypothetical protein
LSEHKNGLVLTAEVLKVPNRDLIWEQQEIASVPALTKSAAKWVQRSSPRINVPASRTLGAWPGFGMPASPGRFWHRLCVQTFYLATEPTACSGIALHSAFAQDAIHPTPSSNAGENRRMSPLTSAAMDLVCAFPLQRCSSMTEPREWHRP